MSKLYSQKHEKGATTDYKVTFEYEKLLPLLQTTKNLIDLLHLSEYAGLRDVSHVDENIVGRVAV